MDTLVAAQMALAACQDLLFAVLAGVLVCAALLPRAAASGTRSGWDPLYTDLRRALGGRQLYAGLALVVACGLYLWLQAAVMSGSPLTQASAALLPVLTESHYGSAWIVGCLGAAWAVLATLAMPISDRRGSRAAWLAVCIGAVIYAAGKAAASHAADDGDFTLREAVHVIHLCATAVWAGSVIAAIGVLRRLGATVDADPVHTASVAGITFRTRLSHLATVALAVVLISGIYNATRDTAAATVPLLSTPYGKILVVKLVVVAFAVMLGGWNRMSYLPQMRVRLDATDSDPARARAVRHFDRLLAIEAVAMVAILILAGVLGHTSPTSG